MRMIQISTESFIEKFTTLILDDMITSNKQNATHDMKYGTP